MRHALALELSFSLGSVPVFFREVSKIDVYSFRNKWTRRYGAITCGKPLVLAMALMKDDSMGSLELLYTGHFDAVEDRVDNKLEVSNGSTATIEVVGSCNREEVGHTGADFLQKFFCL